MNKEVDYEKGIRKLYELGYSMKDFRKKIQKSNSKKTVLEGIQMVEKILEKYEFAEGRLDNRAEEFKEVMGAMFENHYDALKFLILELKISLKESRIRLEELKICRVCRHKHKELVDICEMCGVTFE